LKAQVLALLQAHESAGDFLKHAQLISPASLLTEKPGDRIGRYKLLQQIGEGGCGVVYMAEQEQPVRRRVALKVIKLGWTPNRSSPASKPSGKRWPSWIIRTLPKCWRPGRPMRPPLLRHGAGARHQDHRVLRREQTLDSRSTQSVHPGLSGHPARASKGIIHRDIKPSNILVTINDGRPVPKVIDFGIAKATQGRLTDHTLFTAFEQSSAHRPT